MSKSVDFNGLVPVDASGNPLSWSIHSCGNDFQCKADQNVKSPLTLDGTIATLKVPDQAIKASFSASEDIRISEHKDLEDYFVIPKNTIFSVDTFKTEKIFLKLDSALSGKVNFLFCII